MGEKSQDEWDNQKILKVSRKEQKQPPPKKVIHTEMLLWMPQDSQHWLLEESAAMSSNFWGKITFTLHLVKWSSWRAK